VVSPSHGFGKEYPECLRITHAESVVSPSYGFGMQSRAEGQVAGASRPGFF